MKDKFGLQELLSYEGIFMIDTSRKILRVFISSTRADLVKERELVLNAIRLLDFKDIAMEYFGADPRESIDVCLEKVRSSDIYVGIIAHRYGSIVEETGKSYTQMEYEEAIENDIPCLIYLRSDDFPIPPKNMERNGESIVKLEEFKSHLKEKHTPSYFSDDIDLAIKVVVDLSKQIKTLDYEVLEGILSYARARPPTIVKINYFTASPSEIGIGGDSMLSWSVSDATSITIFPGIGNVTLTGTRSVFPAETTTYTLTATRGDRSTDVSVQVVVRARANSTLTLDIENGPVGTVVTASGSGFTAEGTVNMITINGDPCTIIDTILIDNVGKFTGAFVIPSVGNLGIYEITVTDSNGLEANSDFLITGLAEIEVLPTYGSPGATISLTGSNFTQIAGTEVTVTMNSNPTVTLVVVDTDADGSFVTTFVSPAVRFQTYTVTATDEYFIKADDAFKVGIIALIINPVSGKVGTRIEITGIGFAPGFYNLIFGDMLYEEYSIVSGGEAISDLFYVPNVDPGIYDVTVIDTVENELAVQFTVTP